MPTAALTVANRYPRAFSPGSRTRSAATVCERSPPASCISSTWPVAPCGVELATIFATPGRCQSSLSLVVSTVRYPCCPARRMLSQAASSTASLPEEYGGRRRGVVTPAAPATASCASRSSSDCRQGGRVDSSAWVKVWMPTWCPSATIRRTRSGCWAARVPTTKKVACTWLRRRMSRTCGVHRGSGPSSKVSAMVRSAGRAVRGLSPLASTTGPPWATEAGTSAARPGAAAVPSAASLSMWWL